MLKIYNTESQQKEMFKPIIDNQVSIYVCGVTVYDYCHIGNARTLMAFDIVVRYLRFRGFNVRYVRNITDIDDKIIKRANEQGEGFMAVVSRFTKAMHEDFAAIGLLTPDHEPRATQYIPQMIALIQNMIARNHAYVAQNGDVYFDVRSFKKYGCLSHHDIEQLERGARVEVTEVKRDPLDFVLWKRAKPNEPSWISPWGEGRPGWHIECSAMSMELLGETFDLHGGGRDLIFPHHENEIAQSEAATGKHFVNIWMHAGFLQVEKEKMSKSLGNFFTVREVLATCEPEVLRYLLLSSHYRSSLQYGADSLHQAKQALIRFYTALRFLPEADPVENTSYEAQFIEAMDDDFNTPVALSVLFELAHEIQRVRLIDEVKAAAYGALLRKLGGVLGILQMAPEVYFQAGSEMNVAEIERLIAARVAARHAKNWAEADRIRNQLLEMGVIIEDGAQSTTWKKA